MEKQIILSLKEVAQKEYDLAKERNNYEQGYWRGQLDILNKLLVALNTEAEKNLGMGFD